MSFILVQFWGNFLPPIIEIPMGDVPGESQPPGNYPIPSQVGGPTLSRLSSPGVSEVQDISDQYPDPSTAAFQHGSPPSFQMQPQQQFTSLYQTRQNLPPSLQTGLTTSQANIVQTQGSGRGSSFNMASLGGALPDSPNFGQSFIQQASQRFQSGPSQPALMYQLQQNAQFPGQMNIHQPSNPVYNMQFSQQYLGKYPQQIPPLHQQSSSSPSSQFVSNQGFMPALQTQQISPYFYQPGPSQYGQQTQSYQMNQPQTYGASYGRRVSSSGEGNFSSQQRNSDNHGGQSTQNSNSSARASGTASAGGQSSVLRGPPRKPKQSGHALWVGNLPPGTNVIDLKEHFSRNATNDILSVFLISKSNCAFVNYKTEESCSAAMTRFHDSRFQGVRLVCRLRRTSVNPSTGVPMGPPAASGSQSAVIEPVTEAESAVPEPGPSIEVREDISGTPLAKDKFFIVKSLTVEDLELSVRNGVWATQSHNEEALNKAYESTENVYLIFSANKSGEYYGYARMTSPINDDPAAAIEFAPKAQAVEDPDLPKAIPTPATEFAPKGRIIDDSARGTIFWEAEFDEDDTGTGDSEEQRSDQSDQEESSTPPKAWGKPFKVEWVSTNRLPFYRTRGLRNPWNSNREVKIARDGTELETSVGRRLIQMFHREPSPTGPTMPMPPLMGGYPQMRPY